MTGEARKDITGDGDGGNGNSTTNSSKGNANRRKETRSIHKVAGAAWAVEVLGSWEMLSWYAAGAGGIGDGGEVSFFFFFF